MVGAMRGRICLARAIFLRRKERARTTTAYVQEQRLHRDAKSDADEA